MTPAERFALFQTGVDNGWKLFIPGEVLPTSEDKRLIALYCPETNAYTMALATRNSEQPFVRADNPSGDSIPIDDRTTYWKLFDGSVYPLPGEVVFHNPPTVVVVLVPVESGLLLVRRAARDTHGKLALPGGFQEVEDITWQNAGCREVFEETGIRLDPTRLVQLGTETVENGKVNLLFAMYIRRLPDPASRAANNEILEVLTAAEPVEAAFETHTNRIREFFRTVDQMQLPSAEI
jgi:ADP-ribose pyrophosphatase YjhB (NUDIX family)